MRLLDLQPRWIYKNKIFTFLCPHCRRIWLTCKRVPMDHQQQWDIFEREAPEAVTVGCKPETAWKFEGLDFATMTVTPSLDASASGHWHGSITNGQIVGGEQCPA